MTRPSRVVDMVEKEAKLDRIIAKRFGASFMSDSKWRRFFTVIARPELAIRQARWKFVDVDTSILSFVPDTEDLDSDLFKRGWFFDPGGESPFKRIEWVELPNIGIPYGWEKVPHKHWRQNIEAAIGLLNEAGEFMLERTGNGVRAYGYR